MVDYARANNFTHIIVAPSRRAHWMELFRGSVAQRVISKAGTIHVHVLAEERPGKDDKDSAPQSSGFRPPTLSAWGGSVAAVAAALARGHAAAGSCWASPASPWCS